VALIIKEDLSIIRNTFIFFGMAFNTLVLSMICVAMDLDCLCSVALILISVPVSIVFYDVIWSIFMNVLRLMVWMANNR
jgi:hypothetical protein